MRPDNYLLQQLSDADFALLRGHLQPLAFEQGTVLYEAGDPVREVYFPESGLLSVVTVMVSGVFCETSMVGRDAGFGFVEACGSGRINSRLSVQARGRVWALPAARYRTAFDASASLRAAIQANIELQLAEARVSHACNNLHKIAQRLPRWLLDSHEKSGGGDLELTQDFIASLLSVQRTTVTANASSLEAKGLIRYQRGLIRIVDPAGLERRACECRRTIAELRHAITPDAPQHPIRQTPYREGTDPSRPRPHRHMI